MASMKQHARPLSRTLEQQLQDWLEEARRHDHDNEPHDIQSSLRAFEDEQCLGESAGGVGRRVNPLPRCD
jgi:hypothetical protein